MASSQSDTDGVLGYAAIFDGEADRKYLCPICLVVMRDAVQTSCGHRFCRVCILKVAGGNPLCKCPVDNTYFDFDDEMFPDIAIQREILSLPVKCNQVAEGCPWVGELRNLETHLEGCDYIEIECEFGCSRGRLLRRDVDLHKETCDKRPTICTHCSDQMPYSEITRHQLLECDKLPLNCTQCGRAGIMRGRIQCHLDNDCAHAIVNCQFWKYGCKVKEKRMNIFEHDTQSASRHIKLLEKHVSMQDQTIEDLKNRMKSICRTAIDTNFEMSLKISKLQDCCYMGRLQWKIEVVPGENKYRSPSFYTGYPGYKLHLSLEKKGHIEQDQAYASLFVILESGQFDNDLFFPLNAVCKDPT
ncbi:TNF receptor-associated factor 6-A-like [Mya arenaria]|uniref:TNF receptor-associated factor 6-A-like n=1 Tax=Mya arenaria TaxID=6604 RepID=UPI0022E14E89|nr:TNF receptor-associated factor 6-A-like [Mya arenaria]